MTIAESLILKSAEQEAQMYAELFPEIHPNIKVEEEKIKQAWLDGYNNRKQFEKKNNERDNG
jgi:predicted nucleotide-binding protein (sugar kinase/HSP70/actin superfamily)